METRLGDVRSSRGLMQPEWTREGAVAWETLETEAGRHEAGTGVKKERVHGPAV